MSMFIEENKELQKAQPFSDQGEQPEVQQEKPLADEPKKTEIDQKEVNFRTLREQNERIAKERDEAMRKLSELETLKKQAQGQQQEQPVTDDDFNLEADALAEGKHLNKLNKKIKQLEEQVKTYQHQSTSMTAETRLRMEFPDFDKVVNQESIKTLATVEPELAASLDANPDLYTKAKAAYKAIKRFGLEDTYETDRATAQKNAAKPRPLTSLSPQQGESPLSHANAFANGLTEDLKKQLYKEMMEARNN